MHAMILKAIGQPLEWSELPDRLPGPGQIRLTVSACGVCRTDLHVIDGELAEPQVPIIPGHEIVGRIDALGAGVDGLRIGQRRKASRGRSARFGPVTPMKCRPTARRAILSPPSANSCRSR